MIHEEIIDLGDLITEKATLKFNFLEMMEDKKDEEKVKFIIDVFGGIKHFEFKYKYYNEMLKAWKEFKIEDFEEGDLPDDDKKQIEEAFNILLKFSDRWLFVCDKHK